MGCRGQTLKSFLEWPFAVMAVKNGKIVDWDSTRHELQLVDLVRRFTEKYKDCAIYVVKAHKVVDVV